jgi:tryptophanyl-tRNA synthetase
MKRVLSAVQPTGHLHIGNYLGSIKQWANIDPNDESFFSIADLHALSANKIEKADIFKENIYKTLATYIASGIDPEKSIVFQQSAIPQHSELFWIFSSVCQIGKLNRMTQFKDKSGKNKEKASLALYAYPILMAADILLYKADIIPVGEDQLQHIELTNDIAASFNSKFDCQYFSKVTPKVITNVKRIMSLRNAEDKMSKSADSDASRINLNDTDDEIRKKIAKAKTDNIPDLVTDLENRPEIKNLLNIYSAFSNEEINIIQSKYNNFKDFKESLSELLIKNISPIREKINSLLSDKGNLDKVLKIGNQKALSHATKNFKEIKEIIGF